jgi:hypothetical protein
MSFGRWRQQLRLMHAMRLLGRSEGHARRSGSRLQYAQRIYIDVQEDARDHTGVVL